MDNTSLEIFARMVLDMAKSIDAFNGADGDKWLLVEYSGPKDEDIDLYEYFSQIEFEESLWLNSLDVD